MKTILMAGFAALSFVAASPALAARGEPQPMLARGGDEVPQGGAAAPAGRADFVPVQLAAYGGGEPANPGA